MKQAGMAASIAAVLLCLLGGCLAIPDPQPLGQEDQPDEAAIFRVLVAELGSDSYATRETATRELIRMGRAEWVEGELAQARDPEVRWRLEAVLAWLKGRGQDVPPQVEHTSRGAKKTITIINLPRPDK